MKKDWIKIFTSRDNYYINLLIGKLKHEGINAVAINSIDSSYLSFGHIELFVKKTDLEASQEIISNIQ
tara:strand:+ start:20 stop:223 length:204 start_codon:yes stop_codon:yes gene_type:complete